jgi:aryl-alcohol dehydrogenase-like predicted oxidoreductase
MKYRTLGKTDIKVSLICLGTMTWGEQNTEAEGHAQMDYAVEQGINFFDTAELYAIPPRAETFGRTEEIVGTWLGKSKKRKDIILATKVVGPAPGMAWIRNGKAKFDRANITAALEGSLKRLGTDYVDLYQLHWPNRPVNSFGELGFNHAVTGREEDDMLETLRVLGDLVKAGKVRTIGLSNETPWGVMTFLKHAAAHNLPRVVSIQNPYNLLNRTFEVGLSEIALQEHVGLLAYSPLGGGTLSGKYLNGQLPKGSRRAIDINRRIRYKRPREEETVTAYLNVAKKHGLDPCQMALSFVNSRSFMTSNIIGATSMAQLKTDIGSIDVELPPEVIADIEAVHDTSPNPCP